MLSDTVRSPRLDRGGSEASLTETVLVAVVGTGSAGMRHIEALRTLGGVIPLAVPIRPERTKELARSGYATAADLSDACQRGAHLCIVATDSGRHADDATGAMAQGMDVLVEKPLAVDTRQARQAIDQARKTAHRAFVGCVLRFSDSLETFRRWLPVVGQVHAVRVVCQSYLPEWRPTRPYRDSYSARAEEGGVLRDLIHEIDTAGWIFGWPVKVTATLRNLGRLGTAAEELAQLAWETPSGAMVSVTLDYLSRPSSRRITAQGERGTIEWDGVEQTVTLAEAGLPVRRATASQPREALFRAQARAFVEAREGVTDPRLATAEDGVKALAVCDAARLASRSRREEPVER